jgi:hypothetical protein
MGLIVRCAYRKSHSAVFTNVTLVHCTKNLPQYQFARGRNAQVLLRELRERTVRTEHRTYLPPHKNFIR